MTERVLFTDVCSGDKPGNKARREFVIADESEYGAIESDPSNDITVTFEDYPAVVFPPAKESALPAAIEVADIEAATVITLNALDIAKAAFTHGKSSGDTINMAGVQ